MVYGGVTGDCEVLGVMC